MTDQAATLRVIQGGPQKATSQVPRRAVAVSGGKGGVGKSTVALNLAIAYSQLGARTLMVDTDLGMADLNLLLGVAPDKSLLDALSGTPVEDVLIEAHGISLLPALNGSYLLSTIGPVGAAPRARPRRDARREVRLPGRRHRRRHRPGPDHVRRRDLRRDRRGQPRAAVDGRCLRLPQDPRDPAGRPPRLHPAQPRHLARPGQRAHRPARRAGVAVPRARDHGAAA